MRYIIAVLAVAGIVVSCLALAQHYGAPAQPIDLIHSACGTPHTLIKALLPRFMGSP